MQKNRTLLSTFLVLIVFQLAACTGMQRSGERRSSQSPPTSSSPFDDTSGREEVEPGSEEDFQEAPVRPKEVSVPKVGVILGPGMALTMAHAGVLKAFDDSKIPVEHIVGIGWGSVVGALYSKQGMANDAQWRIYKLKKEDLPGKSFFSSSIKADSVSSMRGFLTDGLQKSLIDKGKVAFACPTMSLQNGKTYWQRRGSLVDAVSKCISFPPLFHPVSKSLVGDLFSFGNSVKYLKQRGVELIIYVDVFHKGELLSKENLSDNYASFILWNEIRRLSVEARGMMGEVIAVNTGPFGLMDFDKKQVLVKKGEAAGQKAVRRIVEKYGF